MMRDVVDSPGAPGSIGANGEVILSNFSVGKESSGGGGGCSDRGSNNGGVQLRERVAELQEENRQLRDQLKMNPNRDQNVDIMQQHARPASGASTQRFPEPLQLHPATSVAVGASVHRVSDQGAPPRMQCMSVPSNSQPGTATTSNTQVVGTVVAAQHEEPLRQIVYSTVHTENTATIGPTPLQGVGTVDGVASVARILLQRIHSSVCAAHR